MKKKILALTLLIIMLISGLPSFADTDYTKIKLDAQVITTASQMDKLTKSGNDAPEWVRFNVKDPLQLMAGLNDEISPEIKQDTRLDEIDSYLNALRIDPNVIVKDKYTYPNTINGKTFINESDVTGSIIVSQPQRQGDSAVFSSSKTTQVIPATGAYNSEAIYPGNILTFDNNSLYKGNYDFNSIDIKRSGGTISLDNNKTFEIEDMSYSKKKYADIESKMYTLMGTNDRDRQYIIRIASASSPEQLSAFLGVNEQSLNNALNVDHEKWQAIRNGELQLTVVSIQQVFCTLKFESSLEKPSHLFGLDVDLKDVYKLGDDTMLIRKVNYGRQYMLTAELNLCCTPTEERVDLTNALTTVFSGRNVTTEGEKNALKYASINAFEIGRKSADWEDVDTEEYHHSLPEFIGFLSREKKFQNTRANQCLVPVSFEATVFGGSSAKNVTMNYDVSEYRFVGKKTEGAEEFKFIDNANGPNNTCSFDSWGIDINAFNNSNSIAEKYYQILREYDVTINIPAYKLIYGYTFSLSAGRYRKAGDGGDAWIASENGRLYNGAGIYAYDDEDNNLYARKHWLSYTKIALEQESRSGTDRSRIDSSVNYSWTVSQNGNPFYSKCGSYSGSGWGEARSFIGYYNYYEAAGRNLEMANNYGAGTGGDDEVINEEDSSKDNPQQTKNKPVKPHNSSDSSKTGTLVLTDVTGYADDTQADTLVSDVASKDKTNSDDEDVSEALIGKNEDTQVNEENEGDIDKGNIPVIPIAAGAAVCIAVATLLLRKRKM